MKDSEKIYQIHHWLKYVKNTETKEKIQKSIIDCIVLDMAYTNALQVEVMEALGISPDVFIQKYWKMIRLMINEGIGIDDILLEIIQEEHGKTDV